MTRFALLGGFLGAGKTTLIGQIARQYVEAGKTVGIITNDQAADLVDTQNLRSQGFSVGEVAGACFCCSFDEMVATADRLAETGAPDLLLAEPVGSCTDLVATIVLPLQQMLGDRFQLAPFGVILKPSHGERILGRGETMRSGFSPQAEYIFRKQLEEADYLMIGRADTIDPARLDELRQRLGEVAPGVPVVAVSPKTGQGVEEVIGYLESPMQAGRRLLEIDYDTYADGEAELGWVNLTATAMTDVESELDSDVSLLVQEIGRQIIEGSEGAIAHVKASIAGDSTQAVANLVDNFSGIEMGLSCGRSVRGPLEIVVNARVSMDPGQLQKICENAVRHLAAAKSMTIENLSARALRPGRPVPTHRVAVGG